MRDSCSLEERAQGREFLFASIYFRFHSFRFIARSKYDYYQHIDRGRDVDIDRSTITYDDRCIPMHIDRFPLRSGLSF